MTMPRAKFHSDVIGRPTSTCQACPSVVKRFRQPERNAHSLRHVVKRGRPATFATVQYASFRLSSKSTRFYFSALGNLLCKPSARERRLFSSRPGGSRRQDALQCLACDPLTAFSGISLFWRHASTNIDLVDRPSNCVYGSSALFGAGRSWRASFTCCDTKHKRPRGMNLSLHDVTREPTKRPRA